MTRLLSHRGDHAVSIYFPTAEADEAITKNRIRFKNALQEAEDALREAGADDATIDRTLGPVRDWEHDDRRWAHQGHGMAIFLHDGKVDDFRLPATVEARTLVGDRFHMLPLLQLRHSSCPHYVLCLEQSGPTLYSASAFSFDEVVMDFPSLEDALGHELTDKHEKGHSTNSDGGRWIIHGHGDGSDEEHKRELRKYCRIIDEKVRTYLPNDRTPLVVVAVEYVGAIYADASHHPKLVGTVAGNPGSFDRDELHRRAFTVAEPHFREPEERDLETLQEAVHKDQAAASLEQVLKAADAGRVEVLFLEPNGLITGQWKPTERELGDAPDTPRSEHALLDLAARSVLDKGGRLRFVDGESLPVDEPVAAILRY